MFRVSNWSLCLPLVAGLAGAACNGDSGRPTYPHYDKTIWTLAGENGLTKFQSLGDKGKVKLFLDDTQASFTVMAPSDAAFGAATIPDDATELGALLRFHILSGTIDSTLLKVGGEFQTITATTVRVETEGSTYTVFDHLGNSAKFTKTDIFASNGILHIIDKVLTPPPPPAVCGDGTMDPGEACDDGNTDDGDGCSATCTIEVPMPGKLPEVLTMEGFASFVAAIMGTAAETEIGGDEVYTVFAPNDAAFTAFGSLTGVNAAVIENVLLNHIADGKNTTVELMANPTITSLAGLPLVVAGDGATVSGVMLGAKKDIAASNGVAHEIVEVIKPPTALEYAGTVMHLMRSSTAVTRAMANLAALDPDVLGAGHAAPVTIFMPSNMAWMDAGLDVTTTSTAVLTNILKAHATAGQLLIADLHDNDMLTMLNGSTATVHVVGTTVTLQNGADIATIETANSDKRTLTGALHSVDKLLDSDDTPN